MFVKFIEALALGKYWLAQAAARCPWHSAERRLVCIAVNFVSTLVKSDTSSPSIDRTVCSRPARARKAVRRRRGVTAIQQTHPPSNTTVRPACKWLRQRPCSYAIAHGSARPSLATGLGSLSPSPSSIGLACSPHTLVLVFACVMVLGALLYSLSAWFISSCAARTRRAFIPVALFRLPISLAQPKRACPLPPHSLVRFVCICVFRLSLRGELGYSSSHRRLH